MTTIAAAPLGRAQVLDSSRLAQAGVQVAVAALAWGALSFGAVYAWGYWPLAIACQVCGVAGLFVDRRHSQVGASRGFAVSLALVGAAVLLQLVPLPTAWLAATTPTTIDLLNTLDPVFAANLSTRHSISIAPQFTGVAVALYGSFAVFLLGLTRLFALVGTRRFAEALTVLAVLLALVGIVQKPIYDGRIYGLWTPIGKGDPFGPFVNKNHFAGWMLLSLPITIGLLCAGLERGMDGVKRDWRSRVLWLSSPDASRLILIAAAALIMALSLVLTMSRSGIASLATAILLTGVFVIRAEGARSRKVARAGYLILLVVTVTAWVGVDAIGSRFTNTNWTEFNNRKGAWVDAISVARAFPAVGTGLNTYGVASLIYQRHDLGSHYAQSHNDYLQVAAEGGALLVVPSVLCLFFLARQLRRRLRGGQGSTEWWLRAGAATSLVAIALQETVEFSLQMPGNAVLFAAVCAIALHESPPGTSGVRRDSRVRGS